MIDTPIPVEDAVVQHLRDGVFNTANYLIDKHGLDVADMYNRAFSNVERKDIHISDESWRAVVEAAERDLENLRGDLKDFYVTDKDELRETIDTLEKALKEMQYV